MGADMIRSIVILKMNLLLKERYDIIPMYKAI
jgi:hypothetical protein